MRALVTAIAFSLAVSVSAQEIKDFEKERLLQKGRESSALQQTNGPVKAKQAKKKAARGQTVGKKSAKKSEAKQPLDAESLEGQLQALYNQYMADELTPQQYHQKRAELLAKNRTR